MTQLPWERLKTIPLICWQAGCQGSPQRSKSLDTSKQIQKWNMYLPYPVEKPQAAKYHMKKGLHICCCYFLGPNPAIMVWKFLTDASCRQPEGMQHCWAEYELYNSHHSRWKHLQFLKIPRHIKVKMDMSVGSSQAPIYLNMIWKFHN